MKLTPNFKDFTTNDLRILQMRNIETRIALVEEMKKTDAKFRKWGPFMYFFPSYWRAMRKEQDLELAVDTATRDLNAYNEYIESKNAPRRSV